MIAAILESKQKGIGIKMNDFKSLPDFHNRLEKAKEVAECLTFRT